MAYNKLPTRTSYDLNAAADINQLTDNIEYVKDHVGLPTGDIRRNLVYNCEFTRYANQTGTSNWYDYQHPDGWIFT